MAYPKLRKREYVSLAAEGKDLPADLVLPGNQRIHYDYSDGMLYLITKRFSWFKLSDTFDGKEEGGTHA